MGVPKIDGQSTSKNYELKPKEEEKIGNIPMVPKDKKTLPPKDVDWESLGVDIKKGVTETRKVVKNVLEMNNPEHWARPAISPVFTTSSVVQVAASLPSPKPTPEEVTPDESKDLEMKSCLEDAKGIKDFKGFLKPKTDK